MVGRSFVQVLDEVTPTRLEPLERIMDGSMSVDDFIATRKHMLDNAVRNLAPSFSCNNMGENLYELYEFQVRQQILNLLNA